MQPIIRRRSYLALRENAQVGRGANRVVGVTRTYDVRRRAGAGARTGVRRRRGRDNAAACRRPGDDECFAAGGRRRPSPSARPLSRPPRALTGTTISPLIGNDVTPHRGACACCCCCCWRVACNAGWRRSSAHVCHNICRV